MKSAADRKHDLHSTYYDQNVSNSEMTARKDTQSVGDIKYKFHSLLFGNVSSSREIREIRVRTPRQREKRNRKNVR